MLSSSRPQLRLWRVDHQILLNRLRTEFGVSGKVLDWLASYLSNRSQKVTIDGVLSDRFGIDFGVAQDSCLGPLLFVIYSSQLFKIGHKHFPNVLAYTDQWYSVIFGLQTW